MTSTQFRGPDGSPNWWGIQCKGNPTLCWREAGTVCPNGYAVIDKNEHEGLESSGTATQFAGTVVARSSSRVVVDGTLTVQCKGAMMSTAEERRCEKPDNLRPDDCPPLDHEPRKFLPEAQQ